VSPSATPRNAHVDVAIEGDAALVTVTGLVDEQFSGFGQVAKAKTLVIDVSGITRMTSFGVRQWLKAIDALSKSLTDVYLLGCPTFFVDQLNMVLNFGGPAKVLTAMAPYSCLSCGSESAEPIDVVTDRANLTTQPPDKQCRHCGSKLELDESPESYFAFASQYGASNIHSAAAELLAAKGLYTPVGASSEKPPRIIKLVHGSVTYFRVIGTIGTLFRARPFIVGAEGEVVIDLAEVEQFDASGLKEWRRLLKTLAGQVSAVTLVDVGASLLATAGDTLTLARNIIVASLRAPYLCVDCGRTSEESENLTALTWPPSLDDRVCSTCGGATRCQLSPQAWLPLQKASTSPPAASAKLVAAREEILSRALTDASVAQAGDAGVAAASDTILGKYKIIRRLSGGGMADVFFAKQIGIGGFEKPVALKRIQNKLLADRQQAIELFLNEAKIAGRLTHPNIVQVLDVGEVSGALYLAMEYVHGKDLREIVKTLQRTKSRLPLADACYVVREVALALDHAYWSTDIAGKRLSVVHRDVSPHNIILGYDGTVKLLDFGVAMSSITETAEKLIVGKWTYMAPEVTMSSVPDHRSDLFSLGVVLYLLCTGAMPFAGSTPQEIVPKVRAGEYMSVTELAPSVPHRLAALIARLLASNPERRPQRGQDVVNELNEIMRQNFLESSGPQLAQLIAQLVPQVSSSAPTELATEILHVLRDDVGADDDTRVVTNPGVDRSPVSITPSAGTGNRPIDISESFKRSTGSFSSARKSGPSIPIPVAIQVTQTLRQQQLGPVSSPGQRALSFLLVFAILGLVGVAVFLFLSSY